jgi:hypothetical protein
MTPKETRKEFDMQIKGMQVMIIDKIEASLTDDILILEEEKKVEINIDSMVRCSFSSNIRNLYNKRRADTIEFLKETYQNQEWEVEQKLTSQTGDEIALIFSIKK